MNKDDFPKPEPTGPSNYVRAQGLITLAIEQFHDRFDLPRLNMDEETMGEYLSTRLCFIMEELGEVAKEVNHGNMISALYELADLLFVVEGTFHTMGEIGDRACAFVIAKNQAKDPKNYRYNPINGKLIKRDNV